jgi:hypothetical protein
MFAVADQLPVAVLAEGPEASAGTARTKNAQIAEATDLVLTTNPPFCLPDPDEDRMEPRSLPLQNP